MYINELDAMLLGKLNNLNWILTSNSLTQIM
jgi:hypothetical protein